MVVCVLALAAWLGIGIPVPEAQAQDLSWMQADQWFVYDVQGLITGPSSATEDGELTVLVISTGSGTIRVNEVYGNDTVLNGANGTTAIPYIWTYDTATRENLNSSGSAWLWVSEADALAGQAVINEEVANLTATNTTTWTFVHSNAEGNRSTYYFDRSTGLLAQAEGYHVGSNYTARHVITRVASGVGGVAVSWPYASAYVAPESPPDDPPEGTRGAETDPEPLSHITYWFPPYWDAWGWNYDEGGGIHSRHSGTDVERESGYAFTEAGAYAGVGVGWAGAHGWAHMWWPSSYFTVTQSGGYRIRSHHWLDGEVGGTDGLCNRFPFGGSSGRSRITMTLIVREVTTWISVGEVVATIFDWGIGPYYWAWDHYHFDMERDYYLNAGTYYTGQDFTKNDQAAAAWGICATYAHSHFAATTYLVQATRL